MSLPSLPPSDNCHYNLTCFNGRTSWRKSGATTTTSTAAAPRKKKLVIVAGQSNAAGSSLEGQSAAEKVPNPRLKQFSRGITSTFSGKSIRYDPGTKGSIIDALDPLQSQAICSPDAIGFARTFCEAYLADHPEEDLIIINGAFGGTGFTPTEGYIVTWDRKITWAHSNLYNELVKDVNSILCADPELEPLCMLWHQGESDVGNPNYPAQLTDLIKTFRTEIVSGRGQSMPVIVGTMLASWKAMNSATTFIDNSHKWIRYFVGDDITDCANFDHIVGATPDGLAVHFTASGLRQMGSGFYQKYKDIQTTRSDRALAAEAVRSMGGTGTGTTRSALSIDPSVILNGRDITYDNTRQDFNTIARTLFMNTGHSSSSSSSSSSRVAVPPQFVLRGSRDFSLFDDGIVVCTCQTGGTCDCGVVCRCVAAAEAVSSGSCNSC